MGYAHSTFQCLVRQASRLDIVLYAQLSSERMHWAVISPSTIIHKDYDTVAPTFYSVKSQHQQILYCKQSCRSVTLSTGETNEDRKHKKINKSKSTHLNFCQLKSCTSSDNCQDLKHKYTEVLYLL